MLAVDGIDDGIEELVLALLADVAISMLDAAFDDVLIGSFELFNVELLLLVLELFAWVKLPLITFLGNGFGLIISTKRNK